MSENRQHRMEEEENPMSQNIPTIALYVITDKLLAIGGQMVENGGEMTLEMERELAGWQATFEEKAAAVALFIQHLERQEQIAQDERKRILALATPYGNTAKRLKAYLQMQMEAADIRKVDTPRAKVWLQTNPPAVHCEVEPERLPAEFVRTELVVDKEAILKAHKEGRALPPGVAVLQSQGIRIK